MRRVPLLLLVAVLFPQAARAQGRYEDMTHIGTVDSVWSSVLDENRPYIVYTPPSYSDTIADQRYPVLYLLDGEAHFHSVSGLVQILGTGVNGTYALPEMIVVAIPNTDRTRDMTPTNVVAPFGGDTVPGFETSGGMTQFFSFLETELIPRIDAEYRTMPYRMLVGHSLGGIVVINALYTMPETFDAYVAIDPSLWWDSRLLLLKARDYFSSATLDGKALYVAQANTINPADTARNYHFEAITQFNAIMEAYDRSGIRYAFRHYPDSDHGTVPMAAEYDALRFVFDGYAAPLQLLIADPTRLTRQFGDVSRTLGKTFKPAWGLVFQMMQIEISRDTAKAMAVAEMGTELYPRKADPYEMLGDIAAARQEKERARAYYEEALARSEDREGIEEKLAKLEG